MWESRNSHNSCLPVGIRYNNYHQLPGDYSKLLSLPFNIRNYANTVCPCKKYNSDHSNLRSWFLLCLSTGHKKIFPFLFASFFLLVVTWWFLKCFYFSAWLVFVRDAWTKLDIFAFTATLWAPCFKNKTESWHRDFKMVWNLAHPY